MDSNTIHYIAVPQEEYNRLWNATPREELEVNSDCDLGLVGYMCFTCRRHNAIIVVSKWTADMRSILLESLMKTKSKAFISFQETVE